MIPFTLFWFLYAMIAAPFQLAFHKSNAGKQLRQNFDKDHADQCFKRAISLIELHKIRFGSYPNTLSDSDFTEFMGGWDKSIYHRVRYSKVEEGYELDINSEEVSELEYPLIFWSGLGIVRTNVKGFEQSDD